MSYIIGLGRFLLLIFGVAFLIAILVLVLVVAPTFLIGYVAGHFLYRLCTTVAVALRPGSLSRLHRWSKWSNLLIVLAIGGIVWFIMIWLIGRFGSGYISFTYDVICSSATSLFPEAVQHAVEDGGAAMDRCTQLISTWIPWLSREGTRALAIALILLLAMLTLWSRISARARRTHLIERPE